MKRQIIKIDEEKCTGCGECIPGCPEGALQIIDGKARLISDLFCDGLGACIGTCPEGAIEIEEREGEPYNERKVMVNIMQQGENTIKAHLKHLKEHNETAFYNEAVAILKENNIDIKEEKAPSSTPSGCPGTLARSFDKKEEVGEIVEAGAASKSQLRQWPIELHLLNPDAAYFQNADLLVAADCTAFSYGNFHNEFLKGRKLIVFCPKLDNSADVYIEKLTALFSRQNIKSVTVARMEVPCCGGTTAIVEEALQRAGKDIQLNVKIISIDGNLL